MNKKKRYFSPETESYFVKWGSPLLSVSPGNVDIDEGEVNGEDVDAKIFDFNKKYPDAKQYLPDEFRSVWNN